MNKKLSIQNYKKDFLFSLIVLKHGLNPIFSRREHYGFFFREHYGFYGSTPLSSEFEIASEYFKKSIEEIQKNIIDGIDKKVKYHFEVHKEPHSKFPNYYLNDLKSFRIKDFSINSLISFFPTFMIDSYKEDQQFYEVDNENRSYSDLPYKAVKQLPFSFWKGLSYKILENLVDYTKVSNILKDISKYDAKYFEAIQADEYYKYFNLTLDSYIFKKPQYKVVVEITSNKESTEDYDILDKSWNEMYKDRIKNPRVLDLIDYINTIDFDSFVKAFTESYVDYISNYMITQVSETKETIKRLDKKQRVSTYTDNMANAVKDKLLGLVDEFDKKTKPELGENWELKFTTEEKDKKTFVNEKSISEVYKLSVGELNLLTTPTICYYRYRSEFVFERNVKGDVFLTYLKNYTCLDNKGALEFNIGGSLFANTSISIKERLMGGLSRFDSGFIKSEEVLDNVMKFIKEDFIDSYFDSKPKVLYSKPKGYPKGHYRVTSHSIDKYTVQRLTKEIIKYKLNPYFYSINKK